MGKHLRWIMVAVCFMLIAAVIVATILMQRPGKDVNSFQACKDAGGAIAESFPEQCFIDGKSFTNPEQVGDSKGDEYIGLAEHEALARAKQESESSRVVEREGEALPVTMDFMPGRLNFYVKDSRVYKVQVEGEAS